MGHIDDDITAIELAAELCEAVDIARRGYEVPKGPNVLQTPKIITIHDFLWTWQEVETAFVNGVKASMSMPEPDRKYLRGIVSGHPRIVRGQFGDDGEAESKVRNERSERAVARAATAHHVDQYDDIVQWMLWVRKVTDRELIWAIIKQKAEGRERVSWSRAARETHQWIKHDTLSRRYRTAMQRLALKLNAEKYPRRRRVE